MHELQGNDAHLVFNFCAFSGSASLLACNSGGFDIIEVLSADTHSLILLLLFFKKIQLRFAVQGVAFSF